MQRTMIQRYGMILYKKILEKYYIYMECLNIFIYRKQLFKSHSFFNTVNSIIMP